MIFNMHKCVHLARLGTVTTAFLLAPLAIQSALDYADAPISIGARAHAQDQGGAAKTTRRLPGISEKVFKGLGEVQTLSSPDPEKNPGKEPDLPAAIKSLRGLEKRCAECNKYEKSQIYNMFAVLSFQLEKFDDAVNYFKKVVEQSPEIPIALEQQSLLYIAQLSYQLEKPEQSIQYLDRYLKLAQENGLTIGAEIYQLKSSICYQSDKKQCAFENINKAVSLVEGSGRIAEESWYNLQRALYLEREDYKTSTAILEKMLKHYPKKSYWAQLGSMYGLLERGDDQLAAMDTAYLMGAFQGKEKEQVNLSQLLLVNEAPYKAAKIIEKGMDNKSIDRSEKNLEALANSLRRAKEMQKVVPVLKELGEKSKSGNFYGQLSAVYLDLNKPKDAIEAGKLALKKGNFTRDADGEVYINMGIAYFDLRRYKDAVESFKAAAKIKKYSKFAVSWQAYAETESKRYEGLKSSLASVGLDIDQVMK